MAYYACSAVVCSVLVDLMSVAYLNGEWLPLDEARVSVFDRGFMFGDGIYEVMPVYGQRIFTLDDHLKRLARSLGELRLESPFSDDEWRALFREAVERGKEDPAYLYLQVTRGVAIPRSHVYPSSVTPTVLITITEAPSLRRENVTPHNLVTKQDFRWGRGDIKVTSLVANGLIRNEALAEGYDDAVLIRDGKVTEATAANVFIVKNGTVLTPPKSTFLLHGITRDHVISLAVGAGIPVEERDIPEAEMLAADEIWLSSTGQEVWPAVSINGQTIGNGAPGVIWQAIDDLFQASKRTID